MAEYDFIKMQKKLAKYLDEDRYEHTLGVMFTCAALAMVHDCDLITAQTAGLLHDCAKCIPNKKKPAGQYFVCAARWADLQKDRHYGGKPGQEPGHNECVYIRRVPVSAQRHQAPCVWH